METTKVGIERNFRINSAGLCLFIKNEIIKNELRRYHMIID